MLGDVAQTLACPHCGADLAGADTTLRCVAGHSFDIARQGYVNLLTGESSVGTADTAAMVAARTAFLGAGHYDPIGDALAHACANDTPGTLVDVGAGTGHHLAHVLSALPHRHGLALDISKYALRRAARAHPRMGAAACDAWRTLPVRTGAAATVLNVFAPRNPAELRRIVADDGALVVVAPTPLHLAELVPPLGLLHVDADKSQRIDAKLAPWFTLRERQTLTFTMSLDHHAITTVVEMGPSAWHTDPADLRVRIQALANPLAVTASVDVCVYDPERRLPNP
ncbi:putative RNA methyltransferase [Streptomyces sp. SID3343]|uniref:putative RNA methyltransferase n=1 Tax=Streptomyces sp. SID3343 TaxID=2690260 RepID=UPI00136A910A|nr:23S rRNA methyltransferase [Streptomyces sp. SID3343]MYV97350.1 23S rRNA methyltransferase [Streptomyces sp. SID3343]